LDATAQAQRQRSEVKLYALIGCLAFTGCAGANMVTMRGNSKSANAPVNEAEMRGGTIKYRASGRQSVIRKSREVAYQQMSKYCGGPYRITKESVLQQNEGMTPIGGTYYADNQDWNFIDFQCEEIARK